MNKNTIKWVLLLFGVFLLVGIFRDGPQEQVSEKAEVKSEKVYRLPVVEESKYKVLSVADGDTLRIALDGVSTP